MDDPTESAARSDGRSSPHVTALDWSIIGLGVGLSLLLLVGGLLPARERNRQIMQENEALADDILRTKEEIRRRSDRIQDRRSDPQTIEADLRARGGRAPGEIPVPKKPGPKKDEARRPEDMGDKKPR